MPRMIESILTVLTIIGSIAAFCIFLWCLAQRVATKQNDTDHLGTDNAKSIKRLERRISDLEVLQRASIDKRVESNTDSATLIRELKKVISELRTGSHG